MHMLRTFLLTSALLTAAANASAAERVALVPVDCPESAVRNELAAELAAGLRQSNFRVLQGSRLAKAFKVPPASLTARCKFRKNCILNQTRRKRVNRVILTRARRVSEAVRVSILVVEMNGKTRTVEFEYKDRGSLPVSLGQVWEPLFGTNAPPAFKQPDEVIATNPAADNAESLELEPIVVQDKDKEKNTPQESAAELGPEGLSESLALGTTNAPTEESPNLDELLGYHVSWKSWVALATLGAATGLGTYAILNDRSVRSDADDINSNLDLDNPTAAAERDRIDDQFQRSRIAAGVALTFLGTGMGLVVWDIIDDNDDTAVAFGLSPSGARLSLRF